jgi:hypothetical protein
MIHDTAVNSSSITRKSSRRCRLGEQLTKPRDLVATIMRHYYVADATSACAAAHFRLTAARVQCTTGVKSCVSTRQCLFLVNEVRRSISRCFDRRMPVVRHLIVGGTRPWDVVKLPS